MNTLTTKERVIREVKPAKAVWHAPRALEATSARQPIVVAPADNFDNQMLRVLVVDDHHANTDTLSMLVDRWGHNVRRAYDGATGLALAAAFRPDVLLLDMLMPEVTGFEVALQVRRQGRLKQCFIIALTGRTDASHRQRCYQAGVDLLLIKPVAPTELQTLLDLEANHVGRSSRSVSVGISRCDLSAANSCLPHVA